MKRAKELKKNMYLCTAFNTILPPKENKLDTNMYDNRDSIDFATEPINQLFRKMFLPTLVSMVSMVALNISDGAFVGHGAGSDALAAVNIVAPLFMVMGGIGLLFGIGSSVVASIHLAKGNPKAADINLTQGILASTIFGLVIGALIYFNQPAVCRLFGCSETLVPLACSYMKWIALMMPFNQFGMTAMFMVRLDGSPKFAMFINTGMALTNIVLDYVLIFPCQMGLQGAGIATAFSFSIFNLPVLYYLLVKSKQVHLYWLKTTMTSLKLTVRNLLYQARIGVSAFLGEIALSAVLVMGNYVFIHYLGEDGVAAYSVGCYCLPIVFMMGNAIVQSVQPIVSFAHGAGNATRLREARRIALRTAGISGVISVLILWLGAKWISATFLPIGCHAYDLCYEGLPYFSLAGLFVAINIVLVGILQSTERATSAMVFTLLRGFIFSIPCFILLPIYMGIPGLWLALPLAEGVTTIIMLCVGRR